MGLTSLILAIIGIISFILLVTFSGFGIFVSAFFAILGLVFGIIGIRKRENTGIAGTVLCVIILVVDLLLFFMVFGPMVFHR